MVLRDLRVMGFVSPLGNRQVTAHDTCALQLCSACRGDYEDPDAMAEEEEEEEEDGEEEASRTTSFLRGAISFADCAARERGPERAKRGG